MLQEKGFTMVEFLVALAILIIVTTIGVPSFKSVIDNSQLSSATNELIGTLNYTRVEAIRRGQSVIVTSGKGIDWSSKNRIWLDTNANGSFNLNDDDELRITESANKKISVSSNGPTDVIFLASGFVTAPVIYTICHSDTSLAGRRVELMISGRINVDANFSCVP